MVINHKLILLKGLLKNTTEIKYFTNSIVIILLLNLLEIITITLPLTLVTLKKVTTYFG